MCDKSARQVVGLPAISRRSLNASKDRRNVSSSVWLESRAETRANVPQAFAYQLFDDRESIPKYMSWIKEVQNTGEDTSKWMLRQDAFGQTWELSWMAKNLPPVRDQKIHWQSVPGSMKGSGWLEVQNRGQVQFMAASARACRVRLSVQFEVPAPLLPFGPLLTPLVTQIIQSDMNEFARYAQRQYTLQQQAAQKQASA
eukprot:jgi/Ulvmu1/12107/UM084_0032.1